jgi:hypothetical protein
VSEGTSCGGVGVGVGRWKAGPAGPSSISLPPMAAPLLSRRPIQVQAAHSMFCQLSRLARPQISGRLWLGCSSRLLLHVKDDPYSESGPWVQRFIHRDRFTPYAVYDLQQCLLSRHRVQDEIVVYTKVVMRQMIRKWEWKAWRSD